MFAVPCALWCAIFLLATLDAPAAMRQAESSMTPKPAATSATLSSPLEYQATEGFTAALKGRIPIC